MAQDATLRLLLHTGSLMAGDLPSDRQLAAPPAQWRLGVTAAVVVRLARRIALM